MINDIILERVKQGLCPVCEKPVSEDFTEIEYKGQDIKVCTEHTKGDCNEKN